MKPRLYVCTMCMVLSGVHFAFGGILSDVIAKMRSKEGSGSGQGDSPLRQLHDTAGKSEAPVLPSSLQESGVGAVPWTGENALNNRRFTVSGLIEGDQYSGTVTFEGEPYLPDSLKGQGLIKIRHEIQVIAGPHGGQYFSWQCIGRMVDPRTIQVGEGLPIVIWNDPFFKILADKIKDDAIGLLRGSLELRLDSVIYRMENMGAEGTVRGTWNIKKVRGGNSSKALQRFIADETLRPIAGEGGGVPNPSDLAQTAAALQAKNALTNRMGSEILVSVNGQWERTRYFDAQGADNLMLKLAPGSTLWLRQKTFGSSTVKFYIKASAGSLEELPRTTGKWHNDSLNEWIFTDGIYGLRIPATVQPGSTYLVEIELHTPYPEMRRSVEAKRIAQFVIIASLD